MTYYVAGGDQMMTESQVAVEYRLVVKDVQRLRSSVYEDDRKAIHYSE